MSLAQTATKKKPNENPLGATKPKKGYHVVQQGMKVLYSGTSPEVDIVFVPGLGAHPEDSWKSTKGFNWATDQKNGLARDFPNARIMLYQYESAWKGSLKVKQFLHDIASSLLEGISGVREKCPERPVVFIGHSMGGLVIAKALTLTDSRRDSFPRLFECITTCMFFGTPFGGAPVAAVAKMLARVGEKLDQAYASKLLEVMKPGDESLRELKEELLRLVNKLSQNIEVYCFWEEQPTDFSQMVGLPTLFGIPNALIPKKLAEFVTKESAKLPGMDGMGLSSNHSDLVKFEDFKDTRYTLVRGPLKRYIQRASLVVKNRLNSTRNIDQKIVKRIIDVLDGASVSRKRKLLATTFTPSSWFTKETEYLNWLSEEDRLTTDNPEQRVDALFVRGPEGRGKTSAVMAALDTVDKLIHKDEETNSGQKPILLAYFFCDTTPDCSSAEDLLKSLVRQLISQNQALAPYAKHFAKVKSEEASKVRISVENLWQTLEDMLVDEFIGRKVYFLINNLHVLPEDAESTIKLMRYLKMELQQNNASDYNRTPVRWLFTTRQCYHIEEAFNVEGMRLIDLEDERYCDQVQLELRNHAHKKVALLGNEKKYNKAFVYFATCLIGKRASNTHWIDITCVQLEQLSQAESDLKVRRILERMPLNLNALLKDAWLKVFRDNEEHEDKIKEMLRTLVLTYEDPTEEELGVLAGLYSTTEEKKELRELVEKCSPLLVTKHTGKSGSKISFLNIAIKNHLLEKDNAWTLLGLTDVEIKWQHGILALRSMSHLKDALNFISEIVPKESLESHVGNEGDGSQKIDDTQDEQEDDGETGSDDSDSDDSDSDGSDSDGSDSDESDEETDDEAEDSQSEDSQSQILESEAESSSDGDNLAEETDPGVVELMEKALHYIVQHWLHHASKATVEIADELSDDDFWKSDSLIRYRWIVAYSRLTNAFQSWDHKSLQGLHIATSLGFRSLVAALIRKGYADEVNTRDSNNCTPLHLACYFGRSNIVEELLNKGANVNDGIEIGEKTPLHAAAYSGHIKVMNKLINRGADLNAVDTEHGTVLNAAILSGNREAVRVLVEHGVSFPPQGSYDGESAMALAILYSDLSMFEYLIQAYANKLTPEDYSEALIKAAEAGRIEVFSRLLLYQHPQSSYQEALDKASEEENWEIVRVLLDKCRSLDCDAMFYRAATGVEAQDEVLKATWKYTNGSVSLETLNDSLYGATDYEKDTTVKLLLEEFGANPNATGEEYGTALTAAAYDGTINIVKLLLDNGANVNDENGWALQSAAAEGHEAVVRELLDRGADVNAFTSNDNFPAGTALQGACEAGQKEIVELLLEYHADPNLGGGEDKYPIIAAARKGEGEILELLVHAKAEIDVFGGPDGKSSSAFIYAAEFLPKESLEVLFNAGADIELADESGNTALTIAASCGDARCVRFLLNNGANMLHTNNRNQNALQIAARKGYPYCVKLLVRRLSKLIMTLNTTMASGNMAVIDVIQNLPNCKMPKAEANNNRQRQKQVPEDHVNGEESSYDSDDHAEDETLTDGLSYQEKSTQCFAYQYETETTLFRFPNHNTPNIPGDTPLTETLQNTGDDSSSSSPEFKKSSFMSMRNTFEKVKLRVI